MSVCFKNWKCLIHLFSVIFTASLRRDFFNVLHVAGFIHFFTTSPEIFLN